MAWFTAALIIGCESFEEEAAIQGPIEVMEDLWLLQADSFADAEKKARAIGAEQYVVNASQSKDDRAEEASFLGVREVTSVQNPFNAGEDADPEDGTELTYAKYLVRRYSDVEELAAGGSVIVEYS